MKKHLPLMGVGPIYVILIIVITSIAVVAGKSPIFEKGIIHSIRTPLTIIGLLFILLGIYLYIESFFKIKIHSNIRKNKLTVDGVYALVRNPIYSAFMFVCTGILCFAGNLFFIPLFFFYWLFMTVLMKFTEEKWLLKLYGQEYKNYCKKVNRCIPIPKKRRD